MAIRQTCRWCGRSYTPGVYRTGGYCSNRCKSWAEVNEINSKRRQFQNRSINSYKSNSSYRSSGGNSSSSSRGGCSFLIILLIIGAIYYYFSNGVSEDNTTKEENISTSERNIHAEEEEEENISVSEENNLTEDEEEMERDKLIESLNNAFVDSHINAYTRWSGNSFYIEGEGVSDEEFIRTILTEFNFKKSSVKKLGIKKVIFTDIYNKTEQTIEIE